MDKVLLSVAGYDNFIQHIFVTDILQTLQGIMHSKIRVLRIHTQIIFRGTTGQNPIYQFHVVMVVLKGGQKHLLGGVCVNGIDAAAESFPFVEQIGGQHPHPGVGVRGFPVGLRGKKGGNQGRLTPVQHSGGQSVVLHQGHPGGIVVFCRRIVQNLPGPDIEIVGNIPFHFQPFSAALNGRNQGQRSILLTPVPEPGAMPFI